MVRLHAVQNNFVVVHFKYLGIQSVAMNIFGCLFSLGLGLYRVEHGSGKCNNRHVAADLLNVSQPPS